MSVLGFDGAKLNKKRTGLAEDDSKSGRLWPSHFSIGLIFNALRFPRFNKRVDEMWKYKKAKVPII